MCFILFVLIFLGSVWTSKGNCRSVICIPEVPNRALTGHVIDTERAENIDQCHTLCFLEPSCVSVNYNKEQRNCELSSSSEERHSGDMINKPGTIYKAMKDNCVNKTCSPANKTCQSGYGTNGYRCVCPECSFGKQCNKYDARTVLSFPNKSISNTVIMKNPSNLEAFTISMWIQFNQTTLEPTAFSYASRSSSNELFLTAYEKTKIKVSVKGNEREINETYFLDGKWHNICVTWERQNGSLKVYQNGSLINSPNTVSKGSVIDPGVLVLGQEQDEYNGGFDVIQSFQGNITRFNMWNKVLPGHEISELAKSCPSREGNVFKWTELIAHRSPTIKFSCDNSCK